MAFDPDLSMTKVRAKLDKMAFDLHEQLAWEENEAMRQAGLYAGHLAAGGDPTKTPAKKDAPDHLRGNTLVSATTVLMDVFSDWNATRPWPNPFSPFHSRKSFLIVEYGMTRIGKPMKFADIQDSVYSVSRSGSKADSNDIARALAMLQGDDYVLRRTKVEGKVAYILRPRRDGEQAIGRVTDNHLRPITLWATDVPEERLAEAVAVGA